MIPEGHAVQKILPKKMKSLCKQSHGREHSFHPHFITTQLKRFSQKGEDSNWAYTIGSDMLNQTEIHVCQRSTLIETYSLVAHSSFSGKMKTIFLKT